MAGDGKAIIITPADGLAQYDDLWNQPNYEGASSSPIGGANWNVKADDKPVRLTGELTIEDAGLVVMRGVELDGEDAPAKLTVVGHSSLGLFYARLFGPYASLDLSDGARVRAENNYFFQNRLPLTSSYRSIASLEGTNYFEDSIDGAIDVSVGGLVVVKPWDELPLTYATAEILTNQEREDFTAIRVAGGGIFKVFEGRFKNDFQRSRVVVKYGHHVLPDGYRGVEVEPGGTLLGAQNMDFLMKNAQDEWVPLSSGSRIVASTSRKLGSSGGTSSAL
ncbi:MAG: hypothetical protein M5R36_11425 [Deltaproteobacteria bacterium]|nr:hypothetical protein [Deltaproteobacteria bacterium]